MDKELEEAIEILKQYENKLVYEITEKDKNAVKTILNYIENSIPKNKILDKIRERQFELQQEYKDFKDDIELNTLQDLLEE